MKKTSKSPENSKVTPSKKKLTQARLPFMLLSDVSPKSETPLSRKRKLSAPEAVPVSKVVKLSKENSISEELVVVSDDDSKGHQSPKKPDKPPNPYVKLVDAAWKKKLQKSKGRKKSKTRHTSKQTNETSGNQSKNENSDNNECEDVEMVEVEALVHQDGEKKMKKSDSIIPNGHVEKEIKSNTEETNSNSKDKRKSPQTPEKTSKKSSPTNKKTKTSPKNAGDLANKTLNEVIFLDDSNNSADVILPKSSSNKPEKTVANKETNCKNESPKPRTLKSDTKRSIFSNKKKSQETDATPKSSSNKIEDTKSESNDTTLALEADVEQNDDVKEDSDNASELSDSHQAGESHKDGDSDIEMVEFSEELEDPKEKPKESPEESENEELESKSDEPVTPKRSSRIKTKETLDKSTSSVLDESMSASPSTPKQIDKSLNESLKNLTPKQMARRLELAKKREEKEKEKLEREKKRQQEKEERAKQRQEKEDQKKREREEKEEAKKKEREEKEEQKRKEKEEKEKQKEQERKAREEKEEAKKKEKEEKEEQRRKEKEAREEERRKKQEAVELEKQEQEMKLKKTKEAFVSFFVPKQKAGNDLTPSEKAPISKNSMLSSFTVKVDMRLAPTCRVELDMERKESLEKMMQEQKSIGNYLSSLKDGTVKPGCFGKTWPLDEKDDDDDVMIVEDELPPIDGAGEVITCESAPREKLRPKLLSFHENRRPPYWGTWRKKSAFVKPRRPFGQEKILDYEVDSDDDWEDEADGESLDGSAGGSDDEAGGDDYEVDNEVFVPHGYLSDEEATMDEEDDVLSLSPETQKARLKHLEDEFESELKKPTEKLKPRLYGLLWETSEGKKPEKCVDALWNYFEKFSMVMNDVTPLLQPAPEPEKETEKKKTKKKKIQTEGETNEQSPKSKKRKETENRSKEGKKPKQEAKKSLPNQPGINTFLKKVNTT